jgi:CDK-activating kinase assembly factor MAT1
VAKSVIMDEDMKCPHCGSTKYRNPSLKLMVNVCGHALCETCVERLFSKGSGQCPQESCGAALRRTHFRIQLFDDHLVEKEMFHRKDVLRHYNKKQEDFESLQEYNDYLEEIEEIVFNLTNGIDVTATTKKLETYKTENQNQIIKNRGKLSKDEELIEELLEQEKQESILRNQYFLNEDKEMIKNKTRLRESLVDELMFSDLPAQQILATHVTEQRLQSTSGEVTKGADIKSIAPKVQMFSTGITIGKGSNVFVPIAKQSEGQLYRYSSPQLDLNGPECPKLASLQSEGYLKNVKPSSVQDLSGGFLCHYPCHRALQEAFCGLYFQP